MTVFEAPPRAGPVRSARAAALFGAATAAAALLGARSSSARTAGYRALRKPPWQPPPSAFPPVWTTLYAATAASGWRVWRARSPARGTALSWWWIQLALNAAWSPLFFRLRRPRLALADAAALLVTVGAYARAARAADRTAAALAAPYLAWTAYALALNGEIVRRNRGALARG